MLLLVSLLGCADYSLTATREVYLSDSSRIEVDIIQEPSVIESIDILVVLDTSCSMSDDATRVTNGMVTLTNQFNNLATDFQLGFITAHPSCGGFAGPYTNDSTSIDIQMAPAILSTTCGLEQGFSASYSYLTSEDSFVREDADFLLFLVSDEDEQSTIVPDTFKDWLDTIKQEPQRLDAVSITNHIEENPPSDEYRNCQSQGPGQKYIDLMTLYGKTEVDLCSEDWEGWIDQSSYLTSIRDYRTLDYIAIEGTISVQLEETLLTENTDWEFDNQTNTVYLLREPTYEELYIISYRTFGEALI